MGTGLAPLPIQLPAWGLGGQSRTVQELGTLHHLCGRPGRGFWLLASDQLNSGHCGDLESESLDGRSYSLSLLLSMYQTLQPK